MNSAPAKDATGPDNHNSFWSRDSRSLLDELGNSPAQGLSAIEASGRFKRLGSNTIDEAPATNLARLALRQFESPLVLILIFGGAVTALLKEWTEAGIFLAVVLGSASLGFFQEYRATPAITKLRQRLALMVKVIRDGVSSNIEAALLVPGDIVRLSAGSAKSTKFPTISSASA